MGFFQRLLGKTETRQMEEDYRQAFNPEDFYPLFTLQETRQLLEVKWGSSSHPYQSLILAVDIPRQLIWIDELFPQQVMVDVGDSVTLRHHRQGQELVVHTYVVALANQFGAQGIALALPEKVQWQPRRHQPRFGLGGISTLVKIRTQGAEAVQGKLQDISTGGFSISISGNFLGQLRHGALLPLCEMLLDDQVHIRCKGRIRAFRIEREPYRSTRICIEFVDIAEDTRLELMNYLNRAQHQKQLAVA
jgi:c-di-GMP-binding flagellar brake protein YcgR